MEAYNLQTLINNYYLIVPEIQREYVWGAKENIEKFNHFIDDVLKSVHQLETKNVGFLYSYKTGIEERDTHYVEHYIIDGQQRLTSLILLLYVLALKERRIKDFQDLLHSSEPTMKFSYNVRPLTEHFFRLMVNQNKCEQYIKKNIWYTQDFERDMTITSMVNAIEQLYEREDFILDKLYDAVLNRVEFWYFDVKQTSQGEELYISMNSRGQKLTQSEQLKPCLFGKLSGEQIHDYGILWDKWEEYFYTNRPKDGNLHVMQYVDLAMNNFIRVVSELIVCNEFNEIQDIPELSLPILKRWFDALEQIPQEEVFQREIKRLYETNEDKNFMVLKALLATAMRKPEDIREYTRVRAIMRNNVIRRSAVKKHTELLSLLKKYVETPQLSFYEFLLSGVNTQDVLTENELQKIQILQQAQSVEMEEAFWHEEHHCIWNGDIHPLIEWAITEEGEFDFTAYQTYEHLFNNIFPFKEKELRDNTKLDLIRRALLTQKFPNYPGYYRSGTNYSFAFEPSDWKKVCNHIPEMKAFLGRLITDDNWEDDAELMIAEYETGNEYYDFVHDERLLKYCTGKNIQRKGNILYLIKKERASGAHANIHAYKYYLRLKKRHFENWKMSFYESYNTCVYFDQEKDGLRIAIDLYWNVGQNHDMMEIDCFMRKADSSIAQQYLSPIVKALEYKWNGERYVTQVAIPEDENDSFVIMDEKLKVLMDVIKQLSL